YNKVPNAAMEAWKKAQSESESTVLTLGETPVAIEVPTQPESSQRSEHATADTAHTETSNMATDNNTPPTQAPDGGSGGNGNQGSKAEIAELNQKAIEGYVARGREMGATEERQRQMERMKAIMSACPGRPDLALNAFLGGQSAETVKL